MTEYVYGEDFDFRREISRLQNDWMVLKDQYSEIARALGFEGDAWFGDPLASHEKIVKKARKCYAFALNGGYLD